MRRVAHQQLHGATGAYTNVLLDLHAGSKHGQHGRVLPAQNAAVVKERTQASAFIALGKHVRGGSGARSGSHRREERRSQHSSRQTRCCKAELSAQASTTIVPNSLLSIIMITAGHVGRFLSSFFG